ncbi:ABC transporter [Stipitochalara longipes BDJ]|nr:ABC transporter [Stipitochalara longipes BDJ]
MSSPHRFLIQMSGAPGSGKSTLAALLARTLNGVVIDHDLLRSFFLSTSIPFQESAKLSYDFQWVLALDLLKQERSVIIDSTCNFDQTLEQGMKLAREFGVEYRYVECRVRDIELLDRRLQERVPQRSQRTGVSKPPIDAGGGSGKRDEDYCKLFEKWIEHPCRPEHDAIIVDSTKSPEECLEYVLKQIVTSSENHLDI